MTRLRVVFELVRGVVVFALTSEFAVIFYGHLLGLRASRLLWFTLAISTTSFVYWNWVTGGWVHSPSRLQRAVLDYVHMTDQWFETYWTGPVLRVLSRCLLISGIIVLGGTPVFWLAGLLFCQGKGWKWGFLLVFAGNACKAALCVGGWQLLLH